MESNLGLSILTVIGTHDKKSIEIVFILSKIFRNCEINFLFSCESYFNLETISYNVVYKTRMDKKTSRNCDFIVSFFFPFYFSISCVTLHMSTFTITYYSEREMSRINVNM